VQLAVSGAIERMTGHAMRLGHGLQRLVADCSLIL
jgi:hypothetical protein